MKLALLPLLVVLALSGCSQRLTATAEAADFRQVSEYVNGREGRYSDWFLGAFYIGSDNGCDYIAIRRQTPSDRMEIAKVFKMRAGQLRLARRVQVQDDDAQWVSVTDLFPERNAPATQRR